MINLILIDFIDGDNLWAAVLFQVHKIKRKKHDCGYFKRKGVDAFICRAMPGGNKINPRCAVNLPEQ